MQIWEAETSMNLDKSFSFIHDWSTKYFVKPESRFLNKFRTKLIVMMMASKKRNLQHVWKRPR